MNVYAAVAASSVFDPVTNFLMGQRVGAATLLLIIGGIMAALAVFKNRGNGGGVKGMVMVAVSFVVAAGLLFLLPAVAPSLINSTNDTLQSNFNDTTIK